MTYRENMKDVCIFCTDEYWGEQYLQAYMSGLCKVNSIGKNLAVLPNVEVPLTDLSLPTGFVFDTEYAMAPRAIGYDIGCGISLCRMNIKAPFDSVLKAVTAYLRDEIVTNQRWKNIDNRVPNINSKETPVVAEAFLPNRFGTLGGGKHFIEFLRDGSDNLFIMVHSGSGIIGATVTEEYAIFANQVDTVNPKTGPFSFLDIRTGTGLMYYNEMKYCLLYAAMNRKVIMEEIIAELSGRITGAKAIGFLNNTHNYIKRESVFGERKFIHRKGSTSTNKGAVIIAGSAATHSSLCFASDNFTTRNSAPAVSGIDKENEGVKIFKSSTEVANLTPSMHEVLKLIPIEVVK